MDDIGIGQAIMMALIIWTCAATVFAATGSFGLYKLLAARQNPSAKSIAIVAFVVSLGIGLGGLFTGLPGIVATLMGVYCVFGLSAWVSLRLSRR
jgi:hypothetical protein